MTLASSGILRPKREKSSHISSRPSRVKVCVYPHQDDGLDESMTPLPQSNIHLRARINGPIAVDIMNELAVPNPRFPVSV